MSRPDVTLERLRQVLSYDPDTGIFIWKVTLCSKGVAGTIAGCISNQTGYRLIRIDGKQYMAHRLAWLYCYEEWPEFQLDHREGVRDDNRIDELREATNAQNQQNLKPATKSSSGRRGVYWCPRRKKWRAQVVIDKKCKSLGYFDSIDDAAKARAAGKAKFHTFHPADREEV